MIAIKRINFTDKCSVFLSMNLYMFISECVVSFPMLHLGNKIVDFDQLHNFKPCVCKNMQAVEMSSNFRFENIIKSQMSDYFKTNL